MNIRYLLPKFLKIFIYFAGFIAILIIITWFVTGTSQTTDNKEIDQLIGYSNFASFIEFYFGYNTSISQNDFNKYNLKCRNTSDISNVMANDTSAYTYCRTPKSVTPGIGFSWKPHSMSKKVFQKYLMNMLSFFPRSMISSTGSYKCVTDITYMETTGMGGVLADCEVQQKGTNNIFYLSLFYYYPPNKKNVDQVIDVEGGDSSIVHTTIRELISKIHS